MKTGPSYALLTNNYSQEWLREGNIDASSMSVTYICLMFLWIP